VRKNFSFWEVARTGSWPADNGPLLI